MPHLNDVTAGSGIPDAHLEVLGERLRMTHGRRGGVPDNRHGHPDATGSVETATTGTATGTATGPAADGTGPGPAEAGSPEERSPTIAFIRLIQEQTPSGSRLVSYLVPEAGPAHDGRFDIVVLDSIVHVIPDADHLVAVVGQGLRRLGPGGSLAITDVRSLPMQEVLHLSAVLAEAEPGTTTAQLADRTRRRVEAEDELAVHPRFFDALRTHLTEIDEVRVTPRTGPDDECTRFRYDVVLTVRVDRTRGAAVDGATAVEGAAVAVLTEGGPAPGPATSPTSGPAPGPATGGATDWPDWPDWDAAGFSRAELEAEFSEREADVIAVRDVPNARVERFAQALHRITSEPPSTLGELRELVAAPDVRDLDPQELCDLGRAHGYHVEIDFSRHEADGRFDLLAWRADVPAPALRRRPDDPADAVPLTCERGWDEFTNRRGRRGASSR